MKTSSDKNPKVLVCQRGARHRYAIPCLLEDAGLLKALYTDSCRHSPVGRLATSFKAFGGIIPSVQALSSRNPQGIPTDKIFSSDRPLLASLSRGLISSDMSSTYKRWGLQGADVVYNMYGEDIEFLKWAKSQGTKIIVDVFISPISNQTVFEELDSWDAPSRYQIDPAECACSEERGIGAYAPLADILLCPSEWVAEGVRRFVPDHAHKIRVVPYGSSIQPKAQKDVDEGRILFAGRAPLRKGLPYLAEAAYNLRQSGLDLDIRIAGLEKDDCKWFPHFEELNYLGVVEMSRMGDEFSKCDAFVLPSLSEGQAGVLLEALSHGCPVVATRESGVDLTPNENGILVAAKSASELEAAIARIVQDRSLRAKLSLGGKEFFEQSFSMDVWRNRLLEVVQELGAEI